MEKVKLTRKEYREEYLNSEEWKNLRDKVISEHKTCQRCMLRESTDVHHLIYNKDVHTATEEELIGVCRKCHQDIHYALNFGLIPKRGNLNYIKRKTLFLTNKQIEDRKKYRKEKHIIGFVLADKILKCKRLTQQLITKEINLAVVEKNRDAIANLYVTGACLERIKSKVKNNKGVDDNAKHKKPSVFAGSRNTGKKVLTKQDYSRKPRLY